MGCATSVVKYLVFFFNLLFVLASLALIGVGVFLKLVVDDVVAKETSKDLADETVAQLFKLAPILIIVVGVIIFIISFLGCCGAIRENTCMLATFAVILLIFFAIQTALGIYLIVEIERDDGSLKDFIVDVFNKALQQYNTHDSSRKAFDKAQEKIGCCGVHGARDWSNAGFNVDTRLPSSCCITTDTCNLNVGNYWVTGCADKIIDQGGFLFVLVGGGLILLGLFELIGAVVVCCLTNSIRNAERRGVYA